MNILGSKPYRFLEVVTNLLILNLLWLLFCLPVITIFPATAAMFGVIREWYKSSDNAVVEPFFRQLRVNFGQSLLIGVLWTAIGGVLVLDYWLLSDVEDVIKIPLYLVLALVGLAYVLASVYLLSVLVTYKESWTGIIKNSFFIALSQLGSTLLGVFIMAAALGLLIYFPASLFFVGSFATYALYTLCRRAFLRIEQQKGIELESSGVYESVFDGGDVPGEQMVEDQR